METPQKDKSNEQLCFTTIVFPYADDNELMEVKGKIDSAIADVPKIKTEYRFTSMKDS